MVTYCYYQAVCRLSTRPAWSSRWRNSSASWCAWPAREDNRGPKKNKQTNHHKTDWSSQAAKTKASLVYYYWFIHLSCSPSVWWPCRRKLPCGRRRQTQSTNGQKGSVENSQLQKNLNPTAFFPPQLSNCYLIVKGSVGRFLHRRLFLLISDLDNHAGVNVFTHQLSGLRDVNGNLLVRAKIHLIFQPTANFI